MTELSSLPVFKADKRRFKCYDTADAMLEAVRLNDGMVCIEVGDIENELEAHNIRISRQMQKALADFLLAEPAES